MCRALGIALAGLLCASSAPAVDLTGTYDMDTLLGGPDCPLQVIQNGTSVQLFDPGTCWGFAWLGVASGTVDPATGDFLAAGFLCEGLPSSVDGSGNGADLSFVLLCGGLASFVVGSLQPTPTATATPVPTLMPTPTPTQVPPPTKKRKKSKSKLKKQAKKTKKQKK